MAQALVIEMGSEPVVVPQAARAAYHAALAHASNHVVTVLAQARQLLQDAGVEPAQQLLGPLAAAAVDNAIRMGDLALTGPVARGDEGTVRAHLAALADGDTRRDSAEAVLPTYRALSRATLERARHQGRLGEADADRVGSALDEAGGGRGGPDRPGGPDETSGG